jgi:hypothetical protein
MSFLVEDPYSKYLIRIGVEPKFEKDYNKLKKCVGLLLETNDVLVEVNDVIEIIVYGKTEESLVKFLILLSEKMKT